MSKQMTETAVAMAPEAPSERKSSRIATIDWMRGLVMVLMILGHVSMAFDGTHVPHDSAIARCRYDGAPGGSIFHALDHGSVRADFHDGRDSKL